MNNENNKERITTNKALRVLLSILVAVFIWVYVDDTNGYVVTIDAKNVPVEFIGEATSLADKGLMLLEDTERSVNLELSGTKKALMKLDTSDLRAQADLSDVDSAGVQSVTYRVRFPLGFDSSKVSVKAKKSTAFNVSASVGELFSKSVEIRCDVQGSVAENYIAGELQLLPGTLEIRGQQAEVERIEYAKIALSIEDARDSISQTLPYQLYDRYGREVTDANVHPAVEEIQVAMPVYLIKELPLVVDFVESPGSSLSNVNYKIDPDRIVVSGEAGLLRDINEIKLDRFDLSTISSKGTYFYQIPLPDGCENLSGVARTVMTIEFKDLVIDQITTEQIEYENAPEGKEIDILTSRAQVTLRGTSGDVWSLTPEDVTLVADLQGVSSASGSYTVPAEVRLNSDGDIGIIGEYQVKVNIREPVDPDAPEDPDGGESGNTGNREE